jgi:hypothetical protein
VREAHGNIKPGVQRAQLANPRIANFKKRRARGGGLIIPIRPLPGVSAPGFTLSCAPRTYC